MLVTIFVLSHFEFGLNSCFVTMSRFHHLSFLLNLSYIKIHVMWQLQFYGNLSLVTIWVFLTLVLSQFNIWYILSFVKLWGWSQFFFTIWYLSYSKFCPYLRFVAIWVFFLLSQFKFFNKRMGKILSFVREFFFFNFKLFTNWVWVGFNKKILVVSYFRSVCK